MGVGWKEPLSAFGAVAADVPVFRVEPRPVGVPGPRS